MKIGRWITVWNYPDKMEYVMSRSLAVQNRTAPPSGQPTDTPFEYLSYRLGLAYSSVKMRLTCLIFIEVLYLNNVQWRNLCPSFFVLVSFLTVRSLLPG